MQQTGQPIIILRENVDRTQGSEAQRSNIMAAKAVAEAVRTTLGPRGIDKMLVGSTGDIVITNDGATILQEISVQHPAAKMVVNVARVQDEEVGDGTTTACVLVGRLMEEAETLLRQGIHSTLIAEGFQLGLEKSLSILDDLAIRIDSSDHDVLLNIANTAMTGKSIEFVKEKLGVIIVDAVTTVAEKVDGATVINEDDVMIKTQVGESMNDAELVRGIVLDKKRVSQSMPSKVTDARVALISSALEITKTQMKSKIKITSAAQMEEFDAQEKAVLKALADVIKASGASVVLCQKGIADAVQFYLAKYGIFAVEDVPEKDMKYASRALGATIVTKAEELEPEYLGSAGAVEELKDVDLVRISGCKNPKTVTILLRGSTQIFIDELERAVYDGVRVVQDILEDGTCVAGGGSVETELLLKVRDYAAGVGGRIQMAIEAFASAFEVIPRTLAENSGYDPIDKLVSLKAAHSKGMKYAGLDVYTGEIVNMKEAGVVEPLRVKTQAIKSGTETVSLLIRVDDMMISRSAAEMRG